MLTDFPGKQPDEKVIYVIRKHPIAYIRIGAIFLVTAVVPLMIFLSLWSGRFPLGEGSTVGITGYLGASLYLLYSLAIFVIAWLDEEFDLFILTTKRLIDITQVSFLKRTVATTPLDQIQDTTSNIQGILGTLLNYGDIDVQTAAGLASNFKIDHVPNPALIARKILTLAQEHQGEDFISPPLGEGSPQTESWIGQPEA